MVEFEHSYNLSFVNMQVRHHNNVLAELDKYYEKLGTETFKYYMFGSFDILYLSKLNNFGNAQELFLNKEEVATNKPYTNLLLTGILKHEKGISSNNFKENYEKYDLIAITNFKLNNKFLISTDAKMFFDSVENKIKELLKDEKDCSYFILQTFSWHELSVVIFSKKQEIISEFIQKSREITLEDIENNSNIHSNSICHIDKFEDIKNSDIFSDSYSYFGVNLNKFENEDDNYWKKYDIESEIEWQIKPGHFDTFVKLLEKKVIDEKIEYRDENIKMIIGKSDYNYQGCFKSLEDNYKIHKILLNEIKDENSPKNNKIINQVRNFRTNVLFKKVPLINKVKEERKKESFRDLLLNNFKTKLEVEEIKDIYKNLDSFLYKIKVSKHMQDMIIKMYFLYINGLQDPVLSMLFNDFTNFMVLLYKNLEEKAKTLDDYFDINKDINNFKNETVEEIESYLYKFIEIFDSSFRLRTLNNYKFEDISELNIDFNTPIPQILSMYNTLANYIGENMLGRETNFVVRLNYNTTKSNAFSINYNIYDLVHSEFVYFTLPKEILNTIKYNKNKVNSENANKNEPFDDIFDELNKTFNEFKNKENYTYNYRIAEFIEKGVFDLDYFSSDLITNYVFLKADIELYTYWTWATTFKNASLYNINGSINETFFLFQLYRYCFILEFYNKAYNTTIEIKCLNPQFEDIWSNHIKTVKDDIKILVESLDSAPIMISLDTIKYVTADKDCIKNFIELTIEYLTELKEQNFTNNSIEMNYRRWDNGKEIEFKEPETNQLYYSIDSKGTVALNPNKELSYFKLKNNNRLKMYFLSLKMKFELLNK